MLNLSDSSRLPRWLCRPRPISSPSRPSQSPIRLGTRRGSGWNGDFADELADPGGAESRKGGRKAQYAGLQCHLSRLDRPYATLPRQWGMEEKREHEGNWKRAYFKWHLLKEKRNQNIRSNEFTFTDPRKQLPTLTRRRDYVPVADSDCNGGTCPGAKSRGHLQLQRLPPAQGLHGRQPVWRIKDGLQQRYQHLRLLPRYKRRRSLSNKTGKD